jgi:hypothetical protein
MMTEFEAGVRELVARLRDFERRMKKTEDDAASMEQFVKLITPGLGFDLAPTVSGSVFVCNGVGFPSAGANVVVKRASDGVTIGTGTADASGNYTVSLALSSPTSCTITATDTGTYAARFAATSITSTLSSGSNTGRDVQLTAATGFICVPGCQVPLKKDMVGTDSVFGAITASIITGTVWVFGKDVNTAAGTQCTVARTNVRYSFSMDLATTPTGSLVYSSFSSTNTCPQNQTLSVTNVTNAATLSGGGSKCAPLSLTFTVASLLYGGTTATPGTATITIAEAP